MDFRVRQTHFEHFFEFFVKKVLIGHFFCMAITKVFQRPLKSISNDRTVKVVDQNFFHKKFKIMFKMCLSDPKVHPESILNI